MDRDNDDKEDLNCARDKSKGGWWYWSCAFSNLNGLYGRQGWAGLRYILWYDWFGYRPLQGSELRLK